MTRLDELKTATDKAFEEAITIQKRNGNMKLVWQLESIQRTANSIGTETGLQSYLYKHYTDALALATAVSNIYGAYQKARDNGE